jgi:hypothetical protein
MTLPAAHFHFAQSLPGCMPRPDLRARIAGHRERRAIMSRLMTAIFGATLAVALVSLESVAQTRQPSTVPSQDTLQQRRATPVPAAKPLQPSATTTRLAPDKPMTVRANPHKQGLQTSAPAKPVDVKTEKQKACFSNCMKRSGHTGKGEVSYWGMVTGHPLYKCMDKCGMGSN